MRSHEDLNKRLHKATQLGNIKSNPNSLFVIAGLLNEGADPNLNLNRYDKSDSSEVFPILSYAISSLPQEIAILLITKGANVNQAGATTHTPLMWACYLGKVKIVDALLEKDANVNSRSSEGRTALHWAVRGAGDSIIISKLLNKGIDPLISDKEGKIAKDHIGSLINRKTRAEYQVLLGSYLPSLLSLSLFALSNYQRSGKMPSIEREILPEGLMEHALAFDVKFS